MIVSEWNWDFVHFILYLINMNLNCEQRIINEMGLRIYNDINIQNMCMHTYDFPTL